MRYNRHTAGKVLELNGWAPTAFASDRTEYTKRKTKLWLNHPTGKNILYSTYQWDQVRRHFGLWKFDLPRSSDAETETPEPRAPDAPGQRAGAGGQDAAPPPG